MLAGQRLFSRLLFSLSGAFNRDDELFVALLVILNGLLRRGNCFIDRFVPGHVLISDGLFTGTFQFLNVGNFFGNRFGVLIGLDDEFLFTSQSLLGNGLGFLLNFGGGGNRFSLFCRIIGRILFGLNLFF